LQQVNEFAEQLKRKFPQAEFLTYTSPPPDNVINSEDKTYIQLFQVRPSYEEEWDGKPRNPDYFKKPEKVRFFDENYHLTIFSYKQPFKKTKTDNKFRVKKYFIIYNLFFFVFFFNFYFYFLFLFIIYYILILN
jgi:hypothetical protein